MAVGDGNVYAVSGQLGTPGGVNTLFAINQQRGLLSWQAGFPAAPSFGFVFSVNAPAYSNGTVFVQTSDNYDYGYKQDFTRLYALNATNGQQAFFTNLSSQWETYLSPTPYNGQLYMDGGTYGGMYSINSSSGTQNWFANLPQYDAWTPAVNATYCYSQTGPEFSAINRVTGAQVFGLEVPNYPFGSYSMNSSPVLGTNNDAITIINGGPLYPTGTIGGRLISWNIQSDGTHTPHIAWTDTDGFSGQSTLANNVIYAIDNGLLTAIDEGSGDVLWNWNAGSALSGPIVATDNELFVSGSNDTYAVDISTHQADWSAPYAGQLALSDGSLYIATADGQVVAYTLVPEPGLATLVTSCGLGLLARRRRSSRLPKTAERFVLRQTTLAKEHP
jgi:hypothetical protein